MQENVKKAIEHGRSVIKKYEDNGLNETTTRYTIIDPILRALGWKLDDPELCRYEEWWDRKDREYSGRPDYSLYNKNGGLVVLIEAKGLSKTLNGFTEENQLGSYNAAPKVWVLTNGQDWYFYHSKGEFGDTRCPDVSLRGNCTISDMAQVLIQNLSSHKRW